MYFDRFVKNNKMEYKKKCFIVYIFFSISIYSFAQTESGKYDSITIKLNTRINSPDILLPVVKAITFYHQNHPELLIDSKCIGSSSVPIIHLNVTLTLGTSWDFQNPPKEHCSFC